MAPKKSLPPLVKPKNFQDRVYGTFWRIVRRLFPVWYSNYQLDRLHRVFEIAREQVTSTEDKEQLWAQEEFEGEDYIIDGVTVRDRKLFLAARRFHISLEDLPLPPGRDEHWETSTLGRRYLSDRSRAALSRAVWQARKEYWDFWLRVAGVLITAITGLVGTFIGVLALLKK